MPVTHLALTLFAAAAAIALTVWALTAWGPAVVLPGLLCLALALRWAMTPVQHDDGHP